MVDLVVAGCWGLATATPANEREQEMAPKRWPCPGVGKEPETIIIQPNGPAPARGPITGRGICPTCHRDCILYRRGIPSTGYIVIVGYHTSEHSELRPPSGQPAPPRSGVEQDIHDALNWTSWLEQGTWPPQHQEQMNYTRVWAFACGRLGQQRTNEILAMIPFIPFDQPPYRPAPPRFTWGMLIHKWAER